MANVRHLGYFPFCVPTLGEVPRDDDGFTNYPVGVPLRTAMRWYWQVKTWRLVIAGLTAENVDLNVGTVDIQFANRATYDFGETLNAPANEKSFVCYRPTDVESSGYLDGATGAQLDQYGIHFFVRAVNQPAVIVVNNIYYPLLQFYAYYQSIGLGTYNFGLGPTASQGGSISIDGFEVESWLFQAMAGSATISIVEKWDFD